MTEQIEMLTQLGTSLALGGLIGIQRQRRGSDVGGIRTFPILALIGCVLAQLAPPGGLVILLAAGLISISILLYMSNTLQLPEQRSPGLITEVAALLTLLIGAMVHTAPPIVAVALGITLLGILELKPELHALAERMQEHDIDAILKFGLVTFIILPLLPDEALGPLDTLNPRKTWYMVVLVAGMGLAGYVALKFVGAKYGMLLSGFLGGLVSSTATTMTFARRSKQNEELSTIGVVVVMLACTMLFLRVTAMVVAVHPAMLGPLASRYGMMLVPTLLVTFLLWARAGSARSGEPSEMKNPCDLRTAVTFGFLYALIVLVLAYGNKYLGESGLYLAALVSGLTDMDAITLSSAGLAKSGEISDTTASNLIVLATVANTVFKGSAASVLASRTMKRGLWLGFGAIIASGLGCLAYFNYDPLVSWLGEK